jgi:acid phosphatase family membrane protein YuiD
MNDLKELFTNLILLPAFTGWAIAQIVKIPLEYLHSHKWNWALLFRTGGMPSSHSALVAGLAHGIGLYDGFNSAAFSVAFVLAVIVIYDATGIRRQAGKHARLLNKMIEDLAAGHPLKEELLLEFLGHTPLEALAGTLLGIACAQVGWMIFH